MLITYTKQVAVWDNTMKQMVIKDREDVKLKVRASALLKVAETPAACLYPPYIHTPEYMFRTYSTIYEEETCL